MRIIAIILMIASVCFAQEKKATEIDFTQTIMGYDGKAIPNGDTKSPADLTLSDVCVMALSTPIETDRQSTGLDKFKLDTLARKIYHNKKVSLTVEDISTIKERIGKVYGPVIVGAAWRILDPAVEEKGDKGK